MSSRCIRYHGGPYAGRPVNLNRVNPEHQWWIGGKYQWDARRRGYYWKPA
jgi:hypothetical protein